MLPWVVIWPHLCSVAWCRGGNEERRARHGTRRSVERRKRQPAATGTGFSIGTPPMLPHSVHEPS